MTAGWRAPVKVSQGSGIPFASYRTALRNALGAVDAAEAEDARGATAAAVRRLNGAADAMIESARGMRLLLPV